MRPPVDPECSDSSKRIFHNVYQFDVKAMYPSFVLQWGIDPFCVDEGSLPKEFYDKVPDVDVVYSTLFKIKESGCKRRPMWLIVKLLYNARMKTKELKKRDIRFEQLDNAMKAVLNALAFGVMGKRGWGIFSNDAVAETIFHGTRAAQYELFYKAAESKLLKEKGCRPIYSDTDSIYISCSRRLGEKEIREIHEELNKILERWGLELDFEGEWRLMYIHGKKNYILVGDDEIVLKGSYFHRLAEYELPPVANRMLRDILLGKKSIEEVLKLVETEPLDEISIEMHNMISRVFLKTEKERQKPKNLCIVRTPWFEVPWGRLLRLHKTGFYHPRRACLLSEALRTGQRGDVRIELRYYDALQIIDARGFPGWGNASYVASRLCGGEGVVLVEGSRVYCVRVSDVRYILNDMKEYEIPCAHNGCNGRPLLEAVRLVGFDYNPVPVDEYRRLVKKHVLNIIRMLLPR